MRQLPHVCFADAIRVAPDFTTHHTLHSTSIIAYVHGAQQTHVSLAVLAIWRLAVEYAKKAAAEKGKAEAEERVGEIIRSLPSHLIYKSLDGIFKEWKVEKKGGRVSA